MRDETLDDYLERNNLFLCRELTDEEIWGLMDEIETLVHGDIKRAMYRMARKVESISNE